MTENGRNGNYTAAQFILAIEGSAGIITKISERVGCAWHTAKRYCSRATTPFVTVADAYEDECESVLDMAESKLLQAVEDGDGTMIRYYLSTKGKNRGYTERSEISGPDGGPIATKAYIGISPDDWDSE